MKANKFKQIFCTVLAALSSLLCIMGYYPVVIAIHGAYCLAEDRFCFFYIGLLAGMGYSMPPQTALKYLFIIVVSYIGIRFYKWANRGCSGIVAAFITSVVTVAMNLSAGSILKMDKIDFFMSFMEGLIVFGLTILLHYLAELLNQFGQKDSRDESGMISSRQESFVNAVGGLARIISLSNEENSGRDLQTDMMLEQEITGKLCAACDGCVVCWNQDRNIMAEKIKTLVKAIREHHKSQELIEQRYVPCQKYEQMVEAALEAFGRIELNEAWHRRLQENRLVISRQLDAMADLVEDWMKEEQCIDKKRKMKLAKIAVEAKERGLLASDIHIYENDRKRLSIKAEVRSRHEGGIPAANFIKAVNKVMGIDFKQKKDSRSILSAEAEDVILYEDTRFFALTGIATKKMNGSRVSGDSFSMFELDNGEYNVCLSDGMGSGLEAQRESELVVDLMEKFLEAGFKKEIAIKMMNSAMVLSLEDSSFSTLDYAAIDLYNGQVNLYKIGATATFIKRRKKPEYIKIDSLPAGFGVEQDIEIRQSRLENGDFLVMVTDGVLECFHVRNPEEKLIEIINSQNTDNAGVLAKGILDKILEYTGGYAMDDMTVLAIGIWEK